MIDFAVIMSATVNVLVYYCKFGNNEKLSADKLLTDSTILTLQLPLDKTFDDVFYWCAKECGISPLYIPLFALRDKSFNWVKLSSQLSDHSSQNGSSLQVNSNPEALTRPSLTIDLEFRVRFTFKNENKVDGEAGQSHRFSSHDASSKLVMNESVVRYLFHQRRSDFLKGDLPIKDLNDKTGAALGVAVLDLMRLASEMKIRLDATLNRVTDYKKLLPVATRCDLKSMNFCNRLRVKLKFKHYLNHFLPNSVRWNNDSESPPNVSYFYCRYLKNLELVVDGSHVETYRLEPGESSIDVDQITIGADCGIVKGEEDNEQWCEFHKLADMKIQGRKNEDGNDVWIVSISQLSGKILNLAFSSASDADNVASCINGYYMLLTDAHHYLCESVTSPVVVERLSLNCHGPISCAYAEHCLKHQPEIAEGDCVLRQSQDCDGEYFINTVIEVNPTTVRNYKLDRQNSLLGIYGDNESHQHQTLRSLLDACLDKKQNGTTSSPVPFNLEQLIIPSSKTQSILKVYRCSDSHAWESGTQGQIADNPPSAPILRENNYSFHRILGHGKYTTVILNYYNKESANHQVVMKKVFDPQETYELAVKCHVEDSFQDAMCVQNFLNNDYIVQQLGTMKNMMVLEYMQYGSITDYLQTSRGSESSSGSNSNERTYGWFLHVLWQLSHACNYLEEKNVAHGNIRGKNVLLWQVNPQPRIKLADAGVRTHCRKGMKVIKELSNGDRMLQERRAVTNVVEPLLPAPWLAFEFCVVDRSPKSEVYLSINGDKWSFATTACEICDYGNLPVTPCSAMQLNDDVRHRYLTGNITTIPEVLSNSKVLTELIEQCWNMSPQKRPAFKRILREIGAVLASDYVLPSVRPNVMSSNQSIMTATPDLQTFEDAYLVHMQQLGRGHFGQVDLYVYHPPGGTPIKVAVKSFHRTLNTPRRDSEFNNEIETMRRLNHKYIVKLMGVAEPSLRVVMEYLQCNSLARYLQSQKEKRVPLQDMYRELLTYASQIAQGMIALQERRLIHRDLALRNILLAQDSQNSPMYVKLSDFGLSRILSEDRSYYRGSPNEFPAQWYAPECLKADKTSFHFESDIWSYGVTLWEMFSYGKYPKYEGLMQISSTGLFDILVAGQRLPKPSECPDAVYAQIVKCWALEPSQRPKFSVLRQSFDELIYLF